MAHEKLLPYLREARPGIVQIGNYGAMFHGYADDKRSTGWPMQLPVAGQREALAFQRDLNDKVHKLGLNVVGHFRLIKVMGNWKEQTGFVEFYDKRWPQDLLGPKPSPRLVDMLQRDASGEPIQLGRYNQSQLAFCLSSPAARQMFKRMLKVAVDNGVDGVNTNFNYCFGCACPDCQQAFKGWLQRNLTPEEIRAKLGVDDLQRHTFRELPAKIPGYPDAAKATELDWLAMRWGAEHFKQMFDEIFLDYGRTLKRDLIVAQWNHLSHVSLSEERNFLPLDMWGRGEDYFWYSGGAAFVGKNLNLSEGKAGDAWLSCLYVREMTGGKPFVIGKYDRARMAASMAEGFATGGIGMGRYMRFEEPAGFETLSRYTQFKHKHADLYDKASPRGDAALVLPRQSVLNRRPEALDAFRELGQALVERQALLDVLVDQRIAPARLAQYPAVILPRVLALSDAQLAALRQYAKDGGLVLAQGAVGVLDEQGRPRGAGGVPGAVTISADTPRAAAELIESRLQSHGASVITAPWTVRAAAYNQPGRVLLHLVNYDREEGAPENNRTGSETERPKAVENIAVSLRLPPERGVSKVTLFRPDEDKPAQLEYQQRGDKIAFSVPRVKVYGVVVVNLAPR